jgi:uncharacterized protein YceH (UPF0502 family)
LPVLSVPERRILGVMVEKAKTTSDGGPMTVNALVTGSNQKSNRDPILNLSEMDVEEALQRAQQKGLVSKITGGRVERWKHLLYEAWRVGKVEIAVLAELLLRGPQTEGELRGRASRMEEISDVEALRAILKPLAQRGLVVYLSPQGKRGTMVTHGFHAPGELEKLRTLHSAGGGGDEEAPARAAVVAGASVERVEALESRLAANATEIAALRTTVTELQGQVATLAEQLRTLKEALGA